MSEVQALPAHDIARPTPAAPAAPQQQAAVEAAQPAPMSADQQAGVSAIRDLMREASDPTLERGKRDALNRKIVDLQRHVFNGGERPAWYGEQKSDPRTTSNEAFDPMADTMAKALEPMSAQDREHLALHSRVQGLDAQAASLLADFAGAAQFDINAAKSLANRISHHAREGFGLQVQLTEAEHAEFAEECIRGYGTMERAAQEVGLARAFLEHAGLATWVDKHLADSSVQYDRHVIAALAFRARALGLEPVQF